MVDSRGRSLSRLALYATVSRISTLLLLHLTPLTLFDTSPSLDSPNPSPTFRWDALHFASISTNGYQYEQQLAFMPGWPLIMRLSGHILRQLKRILGIAGAFGVDDVVNGGIMVNVAASVGSTLILNRLTCRFTHEDFAWITSMFHVLAPTPAVLVSLYTEPIYALLNFSGLYMAYQRKVFLAALSLTGATTVRATGVFSALPLGWIVLFPEGLPAKRDFRLQTLLTRGVVAALAGLTVALPFILFQAYAYHSFCQGVGSLRPWCSSSVPMVYGFVQTEYWNVGLFNYWTPVQIPNLIIALPVLLVSLTGSIKYLRDLYPRSSRPSLEVPTGNLADPRALPFHLHHSLLTFLLMFSSHTQIALRVAYTDPVVWWNVTSMAFDWSCKTGRREMTKWGRAWVWWTVVWGAASIVLWAAFLPPA